MTIYSACDQEVLLKEKAVRTVVTQAFEHWDLTGKRLLVIIPDGTRTMPTPLFFQLFTEVTHGKTSRLDFLVALGTHPIMSEAALCRLVGLTPTERLERYAEVGLDNHHWDQPETFATIGQITRQETLALSQGLLDLEVPVRVNRRLLDYDLILVCGPVFPHEVVGVSGGSKYFFPGVSGPELIHFTHWLGALLTCSAVIGRKHTPVREAIEKAASFIPTPRLYCCAVVKEGGLAGVYLGDPDEAWSAAADHSSQVHVRYVDHPYRQVLSIVHPMYEDLWTGAKGMYKLEPVVADGGEVILYAPHISELSYTHGNVLRQTGYHVRDYFVKQWERFKLYPWGVLAHATHLCGLGTYENGVEKPRIQVTVASSIPKEVLLPLNLGYRDPASIRLEEWQDRETEGILVVPHAGEILYRLKGD